MKNKENKALEVKVSSNNDEEKEAELSPFENLIHSGAQIEKERLKRSLTAEKESMTLFDDVFFQAAADEKTVQAILAPILQRAGVQADLANLVVLTEAEVGEIKHGVRYDLLVKDNEGNLIDFEVQNQTKEDLIERAQYYLARLIVSQLDKGVEYKDLKSSCVIFLARQDIMGKGKPFYHLRLQSPEDSSIFIDKANLIFVNGSYPYDGTLLSDLIHDFNEPNPDKLRIPELKERVAYLKSAKGEKTMEAAIETYSNDYAKDYEIKMTAKLEKLISEHKEELLDELENREDFQEAMEKRQRERLQKESFTKNIEFALDLLRDTDYSVEFIAEKLNLPVETVQSLKETLENA